MSEVCSNTLDMVVNPKKPDDFVHELPYKCYSIWPLVLWPYPEDFEKLAYSEEDVFELVTLMASRMCCCFFVEVLS